LKSIATEEFGGILDNSAPREQVRQLTINAAWSSINLNYQLSQQHHCPARQTAFSPAIYTADALACGMERAKGNSKADACDTTKWPTFKNSEAQPSDDKIVIPLPEMVKKPGH
jgi:hypothetical protein